MSAIMIQNNKQLRHDQPISPNRWQGEVDCVIGPFSSKEVAEYFVGYMMKFCQQCELEEIIFPRRDAWYIEARVLPDKAMILAKSRESNAPSGSSH